MTDTELDQPLTARTLCRELKNRQKVGLTIGTWATLLGTLIAILTVAAAVMSGFFMTRIDAYAAHESITTKQETKVQETTSHLEAKVQKNTDQLHRLDKKITIIGERVGAGSAMRRVDRDPQ